MLTLFRCLCASRTKLVDLCEGVKALRHVKVKTFFQGATNPAFVEPRWVICGRVHCLCQMRVFFEGKGEYAAVVAVAETECGA